MYGKLHRRPSLLREHEASPLFLSACSISRRFYLLPTFRQAPPRIALHSSQALPVDDFSRASQIKLSCRCCCSTFKLLATCVRSSMVSTRMAAVLAVAVLLLCSSVRSEEMQGTITQVKVSDLPTPPNDTAPIITNPTEGSSDTHSAVLASQALEPQDGPLVLVDLARADNQEMSNMTTAPAPEALTYEGSNDTVLAADSTVPEGFDMNESGDGSNSTAQAPLTPEGSDTTVLAADTTTVPEGFDMNEFDAGSNSSDSTAQATLIPDGQDTVLAADTNTVPAPEGFDMNEFDEGSSSPVTTAQANQEDGPLVLAADTTPVPKGFDMNEFEEGSDSLAQTNQDDEPLVLADTKPVPKGFDLNEFDNEGSSGQFDDEPESLAATQDDGGSLVPGFPTIGSSQDNTHGQGYGVQTYDAGSAGDDDAFAAYQGDQGTLDQGFPEIGSSQGQPGYGGQTYGGENSFAAYNYNDEPSFADEGTLVQGYPGIGSSQDNSQGQGYGVQTYDAGSARVRPYGPFYGRP